MKGAPAPVLLSVAVMVKLYVPLAVGMPDTVPAELKVKPAGKDPAEMA